MFLAGTSDGWNSTKRPRDLFYSNGWIRFSLVPTKEALTSLWVFPQRRQRRGLLFRPSLEPRASNLNSLTLASQAICQCKKRLSPPGNKDGKQRDPEPSWRPIEKSAQ